MLVGFHGYGEDAERMLEALVRVRGDRHWLLVSIQALNRFYNRVNDVVANWMTRQDREQAIADNLSYIGSVVSAVRREEPVSNVLVYAGFSQGVAMAYRAAAFAGLGNSGLIVLAGDVPPDVAPQLGILPPVLIGRGTTDHWYTEPKAAADLELFTAAGVTPAVHVFEGGHLWDQAFITRAGEFLDLLNAEPREP
jgi:predicted esterase